jgi:hypothetical protein
MASLTLPFPASLLAPLAAWASYAFGPIGDQAGWKLLTARERAAFGTEENFDALLAWVKEPPDPEEPTMLPQAYRAKLVAILRAMPEDADPAYMGATPKAALRALLEHGP